MAISASGCGSSGHTTSVGIVASTVPSAIDGSRENLYNGTKGGTLTVSDHSDFITLDPGQSYDALSYEVTYATQRPLFLVRAEPVANALAGPGLGSSDRQRRRQDRDGPYPPRRPFQPASQS